MIDGLSHITFVVSDLERMTELLVSIFDAEEIHASGDETYSISREKFFLVGGVWIAIMEGKPLPGETYNHVAFKIHSNDFDMYVQRVRALGLNVRESRKRVEGEGRSIYFYDYDNHLFELHTSTLGERLSRYRQTSP
ncbi:MAG: FosX/FosE/FosI family fosfomycin resistance hydrolase [Gammaproteobacteria bacterium]